MDRPACDPHRMSEDDRDDESSGNGAVIGVIFAVVLTVLALYLLQRMIDSANMLDCAFTKDPKCRDLIRE